MQDHFNAYIRHHKLFNSKDKLLLAVSGGLDSMALSQLVIQAGYEAGIAHCNFGLRGSESDDDEAFVKEFAQKGNIPYYSIRFNTEEFAARKKISIQMAARELRYEWLEEIRTRNNYGYILTGHHADDSIETFMINLVRGSGIRGLAGIQPKRESLVRPLLYAHRNDLEQYIEEKKIAYREDQSNQETKYLRNQIRQKVLPQMELMNPSLRRNLTETSERLNDLLLLYEEELKLARAEFVEIKEKEVQVNLEALSYTPLGRVLLHELLSEYNVAPRVIGDILKQRDHLSGRSFDTSSHKIVTDRGRLIIREDDARPKSRMFIQPETESVSSPIRLSFKQLEWSRDQVPIADPKHAFIDLEKIEYPLELRPWQEGDRFYPLGMEQSKKLSDFFIDQKLSLFEKESVYLLCSCGEIVWVVGQRIDNRYKITSNTRKVLHIHCF